MTTFRAGTATDKGQVRANNQDSHLVIDGLVFAVADGMGGHRGGEVASALALESLADTLREQTTEAVRQSVTAANDVVFSRAANDPELQGMGTTLTALALIASGGQERLAVANVGDSRAYRLRGGALEQLTEDHSLVESLVRQGRLTPEEAATHPQRNILTRALGIDQRVEIDLWEIPAVPGDRFLLCSDGLFNEVEPEVIAATLLANADQSAAAQELVRLANEGGGRDNITCVVVDVVEGAGLPTDPPVRVGTASEPDLGAYGPAPTTAPVPVASVFGKGAEPGGSPLGNHPPIPPLPPQIGAIPDRLPDDDAGDPQGANAVAARPRQRRFTWRVAVFVVALLGLVGAVVGVLYYNGRNTYYVGVNDNNEVAIFQGRPGGFLFFEPEEREVTDISVDDLRPTEQTAVDADVDQADFAEAEQYLAFLCTRLAGNTRPRTCVAIVTEGGGSTGTTDGNTPATTKPSPPTTAKP